MRRLSLVPILALTLLAVAGGRASAAPGLAYGLQDDAWVAYGPGTLAERTATLHALGTGIVRMTVRWDAVEPNPDSFDWEHTDVVLNGLHDAGQEIVVTLYGTPGWANGGRAANVPPAAGADFAEFASAVATRYPFVHRWTVWNEPNQRRWLTPASPTLYVSRLLNPAYAAIHDASPESLVAGGVTAPRGGTGGTSPVSFIRGMGRVGARLDAYAHNPYALAPGETPWSGGCTHCETITMATIGRLVNETRKAFGPVRLWLTELGYQSNPPDRLLGVPPETQATYVAAAAYLAWATPRVDMLIQYLYRDEPGLDRWQSGLETVTGVVKPAMAAVTAPLAQVSRHGLTVVLWGQVRSGSGASEYVLQRRSGAAWLGVGGSRPTTADGIVRRTVRAAAARPTGSRRREPSPVTRSSSADRTPRRPAFLP